MGDWTKITGRCRTLKTPISVVVGTAPTEICGPNPRRKALIFDPVPGATATPTVQPIVAVQFARGAGQSWTVPNGVTQVIDMYAWGAGGSSTAGQAVNGGGGGGGGAFGTTGPLTVVPGSVFALSVDAGGGAAASTITNPSGTALVNVGSGANAAASAGGAGGAATTGVIKQAGGAGGTASGAAGGGGGGAAGNNAVGGAGNAVKTAGVGGGAAVLGGFGAGGNGGGGSNANVAGSAGVVPGGGAGGGGATTGAGATGADGLIVIFYVPTLQQAGISVDTNPNLVLNQATINVVGFFADPCMLTDDVLGTEICEPWYAISGVAGVVLGVMELSYYDDPLGPV